MNVEAIRAEGRLTKENFWNEVMKQYPAGMELFCYWIDQYKYRVDWERLFGNFSPEVLSVKGTPTKYHDLPIAMQLGIFIQFRLEHPIDNDSTNFVIRSFADMIDQFILDWFLLRRKNKLI